MPSETHTGSAPHTPIRQPDSIGSPPASAASSSVMPGLATTCLPCGSNVTSGAPAESARCDAIDRAAARSASGSAAAAAGLRTGSCAANACSFAYVRSSQPAASAIATARAAHMAGSAQGSAACQ